MMKHKLRFSILFALALALLAGAPAMALTIFTETTPLYLKSYMVEHPETADVWVEDEDELIRIALSRSDEIDLYCLKTDSSMIYETLRDKGYFLPIEDTELLEMVHSVYPELREVASHDGAVCAVPYQLLFQADVSVDMETWERLGLSEDALPRTWGQLYRFALETWPVLAEAHEGISLFAGDFLDSDLASICNQYEAFRTRNDYAFGYDTPEFREVMELFQRYAASQWSERESGSPLFSLEYYPDLECLGAGSERCLRLSFVEGDEGCCPVGISVLAINPNSKHIDEAIEFCKELFENIDPASKIQLCPNENEPVPNEEYPIWKAEYEAKQAEYQERIAAAADGAERTALEMEWEDYEAQQFMTPVEYIVSAEDIEQYREAVEGRMVPIYATGLSSEELSVIWDKRERFIKGEISVDQFVSELERRYTFSRLEDQ